MHAPEMKPIDFDPTGLRVTPCPQCTAWWVELAYVEGRPLFREWHEVTCTEWPEDPAVSTLTGSLKGARATRLLRGAR